MPETLSNILLISNDHIPSILLCGLFQFQEMERQRLIGFSIVDEESVTTEILSWSDIIVFARNSTKQAENLAYIAHDCGKYLIYMMDDELLDMPSSIPSHIYYGMKNTKQSIKNIMSLCNAFMSPSRKLISKYGPSFEKTIQIEEPVMNIVPLRRTEKDSVVLGFAGSLDRTADVTRLLSETLMLLKEKYGTKLSLEFFGAAPDLAASMGAEYVQPVSNYEEYLKKLASRHWDIGLAPMLDEEFHSYKHYIKFLEYSGAGIVTVCSNRLPYTQIVQSWENAVLCPDETEAWVSAISKLIDEPDTRLKLRQQSHNLISNNFSLDAVIKKLVDDFGPLLSWKSPEHKTDYWGQLDERSASLKPIEHSSPEKVKKYNARIKHDRRAMMLSKINRAWRGYRAYGPRFTYAKVQQYAKRKFVK